VGEQVDEEAQYVLGLSVLGEGHQVFVEHLADLLLHQVLHLPHRIGEVPDLGEAALAAVGDDRLVDPAHVGRKGATQRPEVVDHLLSVSGEQQGAKPPVFVEESCQLRFRRKLEQRVFPKTEGQKVTALDAPEQALLAAPKDGGRRGPGHHEADGILEVVVFLEVELPPRQALDLVQEEEPGSPCPGPAPVRSTSRSKTTLCTSREPKTRGSSKVK
jgi:hypothetical protein